jgi:translation initiation factor IF-2
MARKRIHELAKELNLPSKDLIAKAEALGFANKRSQSTLTEEEEERLKVEAGWQDKPSVSVGDERVLTGAAGETLVERRVTTNVIRRRKRDEVGQGAAPSEPTEPMPLPPSETFQAFAAAEALTPVPPPALATPGEASGAPDSIAPVTPEPIIPIEPERVPAPPVEPKQARAVPTVPPAPEK